MGNHIFMLFFGNPRRLAGTVAGFLVALAIISPERFDWVMMRAFNALWPWIQIAAFIAIVAGVLISIFRPKKGG